MLKSSVTLLPVLFAAVAGAMVTVQAGYNAQLGKMMGHPLWATLASFIIGLIGIVAIMAALRVPAPIMGSLTGAPWYLWLGGLFGAIYVTAAIMYAPQLGAAVFMAAVVVGQMLASLVLDHYGLAGFSERPVSLVRLLGAALLVIGLLLLQAPAKKATGAAAPIVPAQQENPLP